jgi:hypothetical protein
MTTIHALVYLLAHIWPFYLILVGAVAYRIGLGSAAFLAEHVAPVEADYLDDESAAWLDELHWRAADDKAWNTIAKATGIPAQRKPGELG